MMRSLTRRRFAAAALLSLTAGYVDGCGFLLLGGYFVSFMSGNTTRAAVDLAGGSFAAAGLAVVLLVAFVAGATGGAALSRRGSGGGVALAVVVGLISAAALVVGPWALLGGALLAAAMGAMNSVFAREGEVAFGITYMTGALVKVAEAIVAARVRSQRWDWVRPLVLWSSIACGAVLGATVFGTVGTVALWIPVLFLGVVLVVPSLRAWMRG